MRLASSSVHTIAIPPRVVARLEESLHGKCWPEVQREGGMTRWRMRDFKGAETILCNNVRVETCHYTLVQNHRRMTPMETMNLVNNVLELSLQL